MADDSTIIAFLKSVKSCDRIIIIPTEKNRQTRFSLGITVEDQEDIIRNLKKEDYIEGPVDDYEKSEVTKLWKFKHQYEKTIFYVKIKEIEIIDKKRTVKCISCHIDNI